MNSTNYGDIVAGTIIGIVGLLIVALWMKCTVIPWYKRTRQLNPGENNAIADHEMTIDFDPLAQDFHQELPRIWEAHSGSSLKQQPNVTQYEPRRTSTPMESMQIEHHGAESPYINAFSSSFLSNTDPATSKQIMETDQESFPPFDPHYRPSVPIPMQIPPNGQVIVDTISPTLLNGKVGSMAMTIDIPNRVHHARRARAYT